MTMARKAQVDPQATAFYHCITRCVRRAFLCGDDKVSGKCFDHRKDWVVDQLRLLSSAFCIDVCAYAAMSNHVHLVLRVDADRAKGLSDDDVLARYKVVFPRSVAELDARPASVAKKRIALFRQRLFDLSWFMRCLNEHIARRANREDGCTGRFWEGRFKSQALLDEAALLTCMSYVDLNPVRAGLSTSLEDSDFTSIQQRLREAARKSSDAARKTKATTEPRGPRLLPFASRGVPERARLPMHLDDYIALVTWTGQALREDKRGALPPAASALLTRFGIESEHWLTAVRDFHRCFFTMAGHIHSIEVECERQGLAKTKGTSFARRLFSAA
jgi:REP element-mobilizing transposase RayT